MNERITELTAAIFRAAMDNYGYTNARGQLLDADSWLYLEGLTRDELHEELASIKRYQWCEWAHEERAHGS